jgi:hypothetical protein
MQEEEKVVASLTTDEIEKLAKIASSLVRHSAYEIMEHAATYEKAKKDKELPMFWEELEMALGDFSMHYIGVYIPVMEVLQTECGLIYGDLNAAKESGASV